MNNLAVDRHGNYFKNFAQESFFVDDFYESTYVDGLMNIGFLGVEGLASEFQTSEYQHSFNKEKINFIPRNYRFPMNNHQFVSDKKYSYYFETTDGLSFASEDLKDYNKFQIKNKIKGKKLYAWYDYRIDGMGTDSDSSAVFVKTELNNLSYGSSFPFTDLSNIRVLYLAYNDKVLGFAEEEWEHTRSHYERVKIMLWLLFVAASVVFLLLVIGAGRKVGSEEKIELFFDPVFIELKLLCLLPLLMFLNNQFGFYLNNLSFSPSIYTFRIYVAFVFTASVYYTLIIAMSIVRNLKSSKMKYRFLISFLVMVIIKILQFIADFFRAIFETKNLSETSLNRKIHKNINIYIAVSAFMVFLAFLFFALGMNIGWIIVSLIEIGITVFFIFRIKNLLLLSNDAFEKRVVEASRSEKTKTELISNVSHDLKTPLTSIIGYIHLLKNEDLDPVSMDYVKVLEQKSNKLKDIIEDLFVLSKSESGSMDIHLEVIDMKKLIMQTLGNMEDKIMDSGMHIKLDLAENEVLIKSDGRKLYRVMQNLLDNALNYSLQGTRIFISLYMTVDNKAKFRIKNTSSYEMDFNKEEITQRFVRGDKSRTKDGSGLGLAIVESFTNALGGNFDLSIDGDVFIVDLTFDLIK